MRKHVKFIILGLIIVLVIIGVKCAQVAEYMNVVDKHSEEIKIVKDYMDKVYDIDCIITKVSLTHNISGFTGGLYQYYFEVFDKKSWRRYDIYYEEYKPLSVSTVKNVKVKKK